MQDTGLILKATAFSQSFLLELQQHGEVYLRKRKFGLINTSVQFLKVLFRRAIRMAMV